MDGQSQLWDRNGGLPTLISTSNGDNYVHTAGISRDGNDWLLADAVGSVRTVVDNTGAATGTQSFTAFGEQLTGSGTFGFAGEQQDPTGLQHLRARQYNPALGRFTTVDPVQPGGPGTTGYNLYAYAGNNPHHLDRPKRAERAGAYGTVIPPLPLMTQSELAEHIRPGKDVSHFVALCSNKNPRFTGGSFPTDFADFRVADAPAGTFVPVDIEFAGPNLMVP